MVLGKEGGGRGGRQEEKEGGGKKGGRGRVKMGNGKKTHNTLLWNVFAPVSMLSSMDLKAG